MTAQDTYIKNKLKLCKTAVNDKELINIINKIYEDGFQDAYDEQRTQ